MNDAATTSTRPYLIRAIHEWCTDNGFTPYLSVRVDRSVQVPREFVNDGEIVLNVGYDATGNLQLGNEFIEFKARFSGKPREIMIPVGRVQAIYARESGQGMSFPVVDDLLESVPDDAADLGITDDMDADSEVAESETAADTQRVVQLVPVASKPDDGDEPRPPSAPGTTGRPVLKRIK